MPLPPCPEALIDLEGRPNLGAFAGRMKDTSLARLVGPDRRSGVKRLLHEKCWHYCCVATPELFVGGAVIQLGYMASAFAYVFDRQARQMLDERSLMVPPQLVEIDGLAAEARASVRRIRSRMLIEASASAGRFSASFPNGTLIDLFLRAETAPVALTAACPVTTGGLTMTQKTVCVPADGEVRVGGRTFRVTDGLAGLDYSHGYFGRETRWFWGSASGVLADGRRVGLNLVEGHNDGAVTENGLWVDGRLSQPGRAYFEMDEQDPMRPWRVRTDDARVDLRFTPLGVRAQDLDLQLIASQYVQPMGTFEGTLRDEDGRELSVQGLPGVVERHRAKW